MMSHMAGELFASSPVLIFPIVAMLLFGGIFVAVTVRTLRTPSREIARAASLPLEEPGDE